MWPAAFLLLSVAIYETHRHLSHSVIPNGIAEVVELSDGTVAELDIVKKAWNVKTVGMEVMAVGLITLGWWLWPREKDGLDDESQEGGENGVEQG
jgi:hypothetical protein